MFDLQSHPRNDDVILSTSKDGTIRLWDVNKGRCLVIFEAEATVAVSGKKDLGTQWAHRPSLLPSAFTLQVHN